MYTIKGETGEWELIIGLEVHAQIRSEEKLFSQAKNEFGAAPNSNVSLVDAAMPGMLPVLNMECVAHAVRTGLAINAEINLVSIFDRKNYFYPDLPQGYQITQFSDPIVGRGYVDISSGRIGVTRIHIEQDAGKSIHDIDPKYTYIDLNRSGVPLMEIVSEPDMRSPKEASEYMNKLRSIVRCIGSCDGDMEKGSMRCDANVSVRKVGDEKLGTRCEIKNLNSTRNVEHAIAYESRRQVDILEYGGEIDQETRLFNVEIGKTKTMRSKEDAHDYRYFPDPDLLPLRITQEYVDQIKESLPELPDQKRDRYVKDYSLSEYDSTILSADKDVSDYFENALKECKNAKIVANWIIVELFGALKHSGLSIKDSPISSENLAKLVCLIEDNTISGKIAKQVFEKIFESGGNPNDVVEKEGLKQITDIQEIAKIADDIINNNLDKVEQYRGGKDRLLGFFVGQAMKKTEGKCNPKIINDILKGKLDKKD